VEPAPASASSAIFGGAKPVDTAKKEREIEEKLQKQQEDVKSRSRTQSERSERSGDENNKSNEEEKSPQPHPEPPKKSSIKSSIFGDAKPVDTTKKEREIEAKLKTIEVDDVKKERPRGGQNIHPENSNDKNHGTGSVNDDDDDKGDKRNVRSPTTIKKVEEKPPNFVESSKFAALPVEDDVGSGKEDSE
jgi:translation initiation factor 4B